MKPQDVHRLVHPEGLSMQQNLAVLQDAFQIKAEAIQKYVATLRVVDEAGKGTHDARVPVSTGPMDGAKRFAGLRSQQKPCRLVLTGYAAIRFCGMEEWWTTGTSLVVLLKDPQRSRLSAFAPVWALGSS